MAYGEKYQIRFKNRIQNDVYRAEIWQKGFSGAVTDLRGADIPFVAAYQDQDILSPIKALSMTISFLSDGLSIEDFYSDDDEALRVDYYFESTTDKLLYSGYLVQDGASEPVTDRVHYITLKASDNLALLKSVKWNEAASEPLVESLRFIQYLQICLVQTGLYAYATTIDQNLPLRIFDNLFENTTNDRGDDPVSDPWHETVVNSGLFQNSDSTWTDCYSILEKLLTSRNACLVQAEGYWNIVRAPEYKLFTDGQVSGTRYTYDPPLMNVDAVTLDAAFTIDRNGDFYPVEEDQNKSILRPLKYVKNTFNYNQPGSYINNDNLQLPDGATPYSTSTASGIRTDKYSIATYFPEWVERGGIASHLEIITDTTALPEKETDRYVVVEGLYPNEGGIQFNPIPISISDAPHVSFSIKTLATTISATFWVRFFVITADGIFWALARDESTSGGVTTAQMRWNGPWPADTWDTTVHGTFPELGMEFNYSSTNNGQWITVNSDDNVTPYFNTLLCPVDGMILIQVNGTNLVGTALDRHDMAFKDIKLNVEQLINQSTNITGQTHQDSGSSLIKAVQENDIPIDDSPRNTIAGTLFTDALSNFDYTDINTGEDTNIGDIYFTKTGIWHRKNLSESLRLGNIITQEILDLQYTSRRQVEGSFRNLRLSDSHVSILKLFRIGWLPGSNFLFSGLTIDYMNCKFSGKLVEVSVDEEGQPDAYKFNYLYGKSN